MPAKCWACHVKERRANAVTLRHKCIDCGAPLITSAKEALRCRKCFDIHIRRRSLQRQEAIPVSIFLAPHGPIHVPEGHSVYWVRKEQQP